MDAVQSFGVHYCALETGPWVQSGLMYGIIKEVANPKMPSVKELLNGLPHLDPHTLHNSLHRTRCDEDPKRFAYYSLILMIATFEL
jgi:hypothetical protein